MGGGSLKDPRHVRGQVLAIGIHDAHQRGIFGVVALGKGLDVGKSRLDGRALAAVFGMAQNDSALVQALENGHVIRAAAVIHHDKAVATLQHLGGQSPQALVGAVGGNDDGTAGGEVLDGHVCRIHKNSFLLTAAAAYGWRFQALFSVLLLLLRRLMR